MTDTAQERRVTGSSRQGAAPEVKARHRAMWALGDYPAVATEVVAPLGPVLVEACRVAPGEHLLDVAAGTGTVALPAARAGARVTASDLTPELLAAGGRQARLEGLDVSWEEGDAEALPHPDGAFDVTTSCVGVMFAPFHEAAADELVRVTRPGGRIGLVSWTPEGFIGRMFAAMRPYAPPLPVGARPAPLWGSEAHVRDLLGDRVVEVAARRDTLRVARFADGAGFRDYFKARYGPTIAVYRGIADDPDRVTTLDTALAELGDSALEDDGTMRWEYLLLTAVRA
ncbi:MAG TPA: methyltransferase domain-containing protein [Ornithinibacter sp.]|nr:methyltransferase domain-containing protein [Ornithinibacter sp.]